MAAADGHTVKVILETAYLTDEEKVLACQVSQSGAHFVKIARLSHGAIEGCPPAQQAGEASCRRGDPDLRTALRMIEAGATTEPF